MTVLAVGDTDSTASLLNEVCRGWSGPDEGVCAPGHPTAPLWRAVPIQALASRPMRSVLECA